MEAMLFQFYLPIFYITPLADLSHVSLSACFLQSFEFVLGFPDESRSARR